jgi:hypothetical protein
MMGFYAHRRWMSSAFRVIGLARADLRQANAGKSLDLL